MSPRAHLPVSRLVWLEVGLWLLASALAAGCTLEQGTVTQPADVGADPDDVREPGAEDEDTRSEAGGNAATGSDASVMPDASAAGDAGADMGRAPCWGSVHLPLLVKSYGDTERYFVRVEFEGAPAVLSLDTGSGLTFLFLGAGEADHVPEVGVVILGGARLSIDGRGLEAPGELVEGMAIIGILGMDFLLSRPSLLDVEGASLLLLKSASPALARAAGAFEVPFNSVRDHALVPVTLDGATVRLMFDTAGGHTMHVGVEGRPEDEEIYVQDFEGNIFSVWRGTGTLTLGDQPVRSVPVVRAPSFPYFQATVNALGGDLHGLLGVTSFLGEALLFDGAASRFWAIPRGSLPPACRR